MEILTDILYMVSASLFIIGIKKLGSPKTARTGNLLSMLGMLIAVVVTLLDKQIVDFTYIIAGVVIGSFIGAVAAKKVEMTSMPQRGTLPCRSRCIRQPQGRDETESSSQAHPERSQRPARGTR